MTSIGLPWPVVAALTFSGLLIFGGLAGTLAEHTRRRLLENRRCDECGQSALDLRRDGCWCEPSLNPPRKGS